MNKRHLVFLSCTAFIFILFSSCAKRNYVYFSNLPDSVVYKTPITNNIEPEIQAGDALAIKVTTLSPEANVLFNSGSMPLSTSLGSTTGLLSATNNSPVVENQGYLVDSKGDIEFPVLGKVHVAGLSRSQARDVIAAGVAKTAQDPIVDLRIINFKVTVIGEVARPGTFSVPNGKINVLEALGMAGDLTPLAVRDNVLVIHEKDGVRSTQRINLHDKAILDAPYFNLQQNDIVYVQPDNQLRTRQANNSSEVYRIVPLLVSIGTLISLVFIRFK